MALGGETFYLAYVDGIFASSTDSSHETDLKKRSSANKRHLLPHDRGR